MDTEAFSELFPLFSTSNPETLDWLLSVADEHEYPPNRTILMEDAWGNAVYFLLSGWVKVRRLDGDRAVTLAILGRGGLLWGNGHSRRVAAIVRRDRPVAGTITQRFGPTLHPNHV